MATQLSTITWICEQLSQIPHIRTRKMFGEYALYQENKVVAFVCDDELFVKITPEGKALLGNEYQEGQAYPGSKPYIHVGGDFIEDSEKLCELILITASQLPEPKPKKHAT